MDLVEELLCYDGSISLLLRIEVLSRSRNSPSRGEVTVGGDPYIESAGKLNS